MFRWIWTPAALLTLLILLAQPARGDGPDGGAPPDAAAAATEADAAAAGAGVGVDAQPAPPELVTPPELSSAQLSTTTPLIGEPTPAQAEPPRPITRRLWFWMAVTGVIIVGVLAGMAVSSPNTTKPECPTGYVCPP